MINDLVIAHVTCMHSVVTDVIFSFVVLAVYALYIKFF